MPRFPFPPLTALAAMLVLIPSFGCAPGPERGPAATADIALVLHGGAGTIRRAEMSPELEGEYHDALATALETGFRVLDRGGTSLDAVEATLKVLEDSPLFNAGRGAVFTAEGRNELDASIMDGATRRAGAVAAVTTLKNPISAARAVMEASPHVLLAGPGAEVFARGQGLEEVEPAYFFTERRWRQLEERRRAAPPDPLAAAEHGTVGSVALDRAGRLAAGTSTGGMTSKRHGRIGDSPLVGAGTWADDGCGVSATGHGEYFIRWAVAHDICARAAYRGVSVAAAAEEVVMRVLVEAGGSGGVIALDASGRPTMVFNSEGMYRGYVLADGRPRTAIYGPDADPQ